MELDLNELIQKEQIIIDSEVNFPKEDLTKAGILEMKNLKVKGTLDKNMHLALNVEGIMVLPCSLTLEPTDYPFTVEIEENLEELLENSKKTQKTIDILPIIWENILMEIPIKVINPNAKNMKTKGEGWELITDGEEKANNSLAKLKDLL